MSNRLPSTRTIPAPSLAEAKISEWIGRLEEVPGHPNRFCVPSAKAVTTAERQALCAVAERLERELEPWSNPGHVDVVVSRILLGFEHGRGRGNDENDVLVKEYIAGLTGLPLAAIHAAAERFRAGETLLPWQRRFRPSPAEFAAEAREGLIPQRMMLSRIRRILAAEVYTPPTPEEATEVQAAAAEYLRGRGFPSDGERAGPAAEEVAAARDAALREQGRAMAQACDSDTMARLMARLDARQRVPEGAPR